MLHAVYCPRRWRSWRSNTDTLEIKDHKRSIESTVCLNSHGKHPVQTLESRVCAPTPILLMLFAQSKHSSTWSTGGTNYFKDFSSLLSLKVEGHSFIGVSDENLCLLHRTSAGCRGFLDSLNCQERNFQSMFILYIVYICIYIYISIISWWLNIWKGHEMTMFISWSCCFFYMYQELLILLFNVLHDMHSAFISKHCTNIFPALCIYIYI